MKINEKEINFILLVNNLYHEKKKVNMEKNKYVFFFIFVNK